MTLLLNPHEYDHGHDHDGGVDDHGHGHGRDDDEDDDDDYGHGHGVKSLSAVCKSRFFFFTQKCASVCLARVRNRSRKMRNWYRDEIKMKNIGHAMHNYENTLNY